jgi:hypothetical protein
MAALNRKTLVLAGIPVACDVVIGLERFGLNAVHAGTSALVQSCQRHLSTWASRAGYDPRPRHERTALGGTNHEARRAGRPGGSAGVPESRRPARSAGWAILSGWPQAAGAAIPLAACNPDRLPARPKAAAEKVLPGGYLQAFPRRTQPTGSLTRSPASVGTGIGGKVVPATVMPAPRMPLAATRGK